MSDEHKAAIAKGRIESRAIKTYLSAVAGKRPGRPVTPESLRAKLAGLQQRLESESDPMKRLELVQARLDAVDQLATVDESLDLEAIEADFIRHAKSYSNRKGISYAAWREVGVTAPVLQSAGIARTRRG